LKERAVTAVQLADGRLQAPPNWAKLQLNEALAAMTRVNLAAALPLRLVKAEMGALLLTVGLLTAAVLIPNPQEEIIIQQQEIQAEIEEQIASLEALIDEIENNPDLTPEQRDALIQPLEAAVRELEEGGLSRAEAMAALAEAEMELRQLAEADRADALQRQLSQAAAPLLTNPLTAPLGEALQSGDLAGSADALADLAAQLDQLSPEQLAALAEQMAALSEQLAAIDPELAAQLAEAAAALEAGDLAAAQAAVNAASGRMAQAGAAQAAAAQAQAVADALAESRGEVAQAGQGGNGDSGQSGSSGQNGDGAGGSGENGSGAGLAGAGEQGGVGGVGEGGGPAGDLYIPDFVDLSDFEGIDVELPAECLANPAACGPLLREWGTEFGDERSRVPYYEVYREYSQSAYEALNDDYIPLGMKGLVRDYFSSLEPRQR
jgi:hypothetical protein